jgi:hypothetical protein
MSLLSIRAPSLPVRWLEQRWPWLRRGSFIAAGWSLHRGELRLRLPALSRGEKRAMPPWQTIDEL